MVPTGSPTTGPTSGPSTPPTSPRGWGGRFGAWWGNVFRGRALMAEMPRIFPLFLLLFGVGMILISLVGDQGLIAYYRLRQEHSRLSAEVASLQQRERRLRQEIHALNSNPRYIETLARRRLGLVRPGEVVIQLPPGKTP